MSKDYSHENALRMTIEHYGLEREPWYQFRFKDKASG